LIELLIIRPERLTSDKRYNEVADDEKRGFNSSLCKQYDWNFLKKSDSSSSSNNSSEIFHREQNSSSAADMFKSSSAVDMFKNSSAVDMFKNSSVTEMFENRDNKDRNFTSIQG